MAKNEFNNKEQNKTAHKGDEKRQRNPEPQQVLEDRSGNNEGADETTSSRRPRGQGRSKTPPDRKGANSI